MDNIDDDKSKKIKEIKEIIDNIIKDEEEYNGTKWLTGC
jgi:hypothetical protein